MAEHLMRARLSSCCNEQAAAFEVSSVGTLAREDAPMESHALALLAEHGVDGGRFRARVLSVDHLATADLVLTATREHRVAVVALDADAVSRTFTLREFARLSAAVDTAALPPGDAVERASALVRAVLALRSPSARPYEDDLPDPYRGPRRGFAASLRAIDEALRIPLDVICGP